MPIAIIGKTKGEGEWLDEHTRTFFQDGRRSGLWSSETLEGRFP
ncbi:hypothetical protein [Thermococcus sp. Bubb.Bath]